MLSSEDLSTTREASVHRTGSRILSVKKASYDLHFCEKLFCKRVFWFTFYGVFVTPRKIDLLYKDAAD